MLTLPTSKEKSDDFYSFELELDGKSYSFQFYWNARASAWFLDLSLDDGTALLSGNKLTSGLYPFAWWSDRIDGFPGSLFVFDSSGTNTDPGRYDLAPGARCTLYYFEAVDLRALRGDQDEDALNALAALGLTAADLAAAV